MQTVVIMCYSISANGTLTLVDDMSMQVLGQYTSNTFDTKTNFLYFAATGGQLIRINATSGMSGLAVVMSIHYEKPKESDPQNSLIRKSLSCFIR